MFLQSEVQSHKIFRSGSNDISVLYSNIMESGRMKERCLKMRVLIKL